MSPGAHAPQLTGGTATSASGSADGSGAAPAAGSTDIIEPAASSVATARFRNTRDLDRTTTGVPLFPVSGDRIVTDDGKRLTRSRDCWLRPFVVFVTAGEE